MAALTTLCSHLRERRCLIWSATCKMLSRSARGFNQCRPSDTIASYVSAAYIQHNPVLPRASGPSTDGLALLNGRQHQLRPQPANGRVAELEIAAVKRR